MIKSNERPVECGEYAMTFVGSDVAAISKGRKEAQIVVDTSEVLPKTSLRILLRVGKQDMVHDFDAIEVYDCNEFIQLPKLEKSYRYQINEKAPVIVGEFKSSSGDCAISTYKLTKSVSSIKINNFNGQITISSQKAVPETEFQISA